MVINEVKVPVKRSDDFEEIQYGVDADQLGLLFNSLRSNLYTNIHGSIVREYASNCYDSHVEAGIKDKDFHVILETIKEDVLNSSGKLIFQDFGVGLSKERIINIFSKYLSSTKRGDNNSIGGFGIGSKSAFAYTQRFNIITRFEGTEYDYLAYIDESGLGKIALISDTPTEELNGTQIIIPVDNVEDEKLFKTAIQEQLKFFPTCKVFIDDKGKNHYESNLTSIEISDSTADFLTGLSYYFSTPQCLVGFVHYNLDETVNTAILKELGIKYISSLKRYPMLKFGIGEINVSMSRETLNYINDTKLAIKNKYIKFIDYLYEELETLINNYSNYIEFFTSPEYNKLKVFSEIFQSDVKRTADILVKNDLTKHTTYSEKVISDIFSTVIKLEYRNKRENLTRTDAQYTLETINSTKEERGLFYSIIPLKDEFIEPLMKKKDPELFNGWSINNYHSNYTDLVSSLSASTIYVYRAKSDKVTLKDDQGNIKDTYYKFLASFEDPSQAQLTKGKYIAANRLVKDKSKSAYLLIYNETCFNNEANREQLFPVFSSFIKGFNVVDITNEIDSLDCIAIYKEENKQINRKRRETKTKGIKKGDINVQLYTLDFGAYVQGNYNILNGSKVILATQELKDAKLAPMLPNDYFSLFPKLYNSVYVEDIYVNYIPLTGDVITICRELFCKTQKRIIFVKSYKKYQEQIDAIDYLYDFEDVISVIHNNVLSKFNTPALKELSSVASIYNIDAYVSINDGGHFTEIVRYYLGSLFWKNKDKLASKIEKAIYISEVFKNKTYNIPSYKLENITDKLEYDYFKDYFRWSISYINKLVKTKAQVLIVKDTFKLKDELNTLIVNTYATKVEKIVSNIFETLDAELVTHLRDSRQACWELYRPSIIIEDWIAAELTNRGYDLSLYKERAYTDNWATRTKQQELINAKKQDIYQATNNVIDRLSTEDKLEEFISYINQFVI